MAASIEFEDFDDARSKFFHRSMDLNCLASIDGMFVDVNTRWHDVLGYTLDDLKARPFLDLIHPYHIESTQSALAGLGESQSVIGFRNRYRKSDGDYVWLQWSAYPPGSGEEYIFASARAANETVEFEARFERTNKVLKGIASSQSEYIKSGEAPRWWDRVLGLILEITESEYGLSA